MTMTPDFEMPKFDTIGPPDLIPTDQDVEFEESESLIPNNDGATEFVQDERP